MRQDSSRPPSRAGSSSRVGPILAGGDDFVPTGLTSAGAGSGDWQVAVQRAVRSARHLRLVLGLTDAEGGGEPDFPTFVPWEYIARIRRGDPEDPLLRQVLATAEETVAAEGFSADAVGDLDALAAGGLLQKYASRALLVASGACGIHCRYCFRREFPYAAAGSRRQHWQPALEYLQQHEEIDEVILSGGDPLTLVDEVLGRLIGRIEQIPHIRRLRIHTRMPVVIPQRVTAGLVDRLRGSSLAVWVVIHSNHPNELDQGVLAGVARLVDAGIPVLNQAVLLRGVNDDAETLIELCRRLVNHRITPYYLHQLDRVRGTAHFEVSIDAGRKLMDQLRVALPGYAVPRYVVEQAGAPSKTLISETEPFPGTGSTCS